MQQVHSTIQTFPDNLRGEIYQHLHKEFLNLPGNSLADFGDINIGDSFDYLCHQYSTV